MPITVSSEIRRDLHVARVLLDSAPLNIIDLDQCDELLEALQGIRDDDEARVVIIQGEGHEFCSGTDIAEHTPEKMPDLLPRFHACLDAILSLDAIVIAQIVFVAIQYDVVLIGVNVDDFLGQQLIGGNVLNRGFNMRDG